MKRKNLVKKDVTVTQVRCNFAMIAKLQTANSRHVEKWRMPSAKSDNNTAVIEQIAVGNRNNVTRGNKFPLFQSFSQEPSQAYQVVIDDILYHLS